MEAAVRAVGLLSVHTSPLEQPGTGDSGGMNVAVLSLARRLARRGIRVEVFTRAAGDDLPAAVRVEPGLRVHHVDAGTAGLSKDDLASHLCAFFLGMATHPALEGLDVLHGHYWMSGWVGRRLRARYGIPLVQTFHTLGRVKNLTLAAGDQPEPALRLQGEARIAAEADLVLANTHEEARLLRQLYGVQPGRVRVVPPGVDLDVFNPSIDRHAARQALGGGRVVLFAGRLQPLKAPDLAVRALAALRGLLPEDGLPTRLVVVGGPSGHGQDVAGPEALHRLAAELGVAGDVAVLAPRPQHELAALYSAADAVILPSHTESFGLVALEALACGTPVVAAPVGGLPLLLAGGGGTLVAERSPEAYAAALLPYLTDARYRGRAAQAARAAATGFGWDRTADATLAAYADVTGALAREAEPAADARGA